MALPGFAAVSKKQCAPVKNPRIIGRSGCGSASVAFFMPVAHDSAASRLCQACGLCCNGVIFHLVRLQPGDSARELVALGLKLKRKNRQDYIQQPCPAYRDAQCSIYLQRPERCRLFECRQLRLVAAGEISEAAALEKIRDVQRRALQIDALSRRADGRSRKGPLSKRAETTLAEPFDPATHPELMHEREELARGLIELDAILDADFRVPPEPPAAKIAHQ